MNRTTQLISSLSLLLALAGCSGEQQAATIVSGPQTNGIFQKYNITGRSLGLTGTKTVALTFDDGPVRGVTDKLLDYLRYENVPASFFLEGQHVAGNQDLLERMNQDGHVIANHSFSHPKLTSLAKVSMAAVYREIQKTDRLIAPYVRSDSRFYFRAPYGAFNPSQPYHNGFTSNAMNQYPNLQKYIGPVFWDVGGQISYTTEYGAPSVGNRPTQYLSTAADWDCWVKGISVQTCASVYVRETMMRQGGIILMHDKTVQTLEMVKLMIPELKAQGYRFITLDEIPGIENLQ